MNVEPYLPAITALLVLANTALGVWNQWRMNKLHSKVNGMYLQTLADAESRGRLQAALKGGASTMPPPTTS